MTFVPLVLRKPLARDGAWLVGSALVARMFGTVAQIIMGIILARDDYLVWGIAISVISILSSAKDGGAGKLILQGVNRSRSATDRSANYGYRIVALSSAVTAIAAPLAGWFYGSMKVTGLVAIGAVALGFSGLSMAPKAKVTVAGRYAVVSRLEMLASLASTSTMIVCGLAGLGAFSFAVALLVNGLTKFIGMNQAARKLNTALPISQDDTPRPVGERSWLLLATVATALIMNVDYMVLGALAPEILAAYFFGFQLTLTLSALVAPAMEQTLLPYFSRLGSSSGSASSLRKMLLAVTWIVVPVGLAANLLVPFVVRLIWGDKWVDATPVIQVFSAGVGVRLLLPILITHLQSRRRWKRVAIFYCLDALMVLLATLSTAHLGLVTVAAAVTIGRSVSIFALLILVVGKGRSLDIGRIISPYVALAGVVVWATSNQADLAAWSNNVWLGSAIWGGLLMTLLLATSGSGLSQRFSR